MSSIKQLKEERPRLASVILWTLAVVITLLCFAYQNRTGPTYPLEGSVKTPWGRISFKFQRSQTIGEDLKIVLRRPVPQDVTGQVMYRRYKSHDDWSVVSMKRGSFGFTRRGETEWVEGPGAELPSLQTRAGKYEYYVYIAGPGKPPVSVTGDEPVYARYKAPVPRWALFSHILIIFASMTLAMRTTLEALTDGSYRWMLWATTVSLILGGFIFGPLVQWHAFGVWWSGIPNGYDWTDNKVLIELAFWMIALAANRGERRNRWTIFLAGVVTVMVYFIPHSLFGSEYNFRSGTGRGTSGQA